MRMVLMLLLLLGLGCEPAHTREEVQASTDRGTAGSGKSSQAATLAARPQGRSPSGAPLPPLQLVAEPVRGEAPLAVHFRVSGAEMGALLRWEFGEGTVHEGTQPEAWHRYQTPGTYVVRVRDIPAEREASAVLEVTERALDLDVEAVPDIGRAPLQVEFRLVLSDPGEPLRSIRWNFGDGHEADGAIVRHLFTEPGGFWVTVQVERKTGSLLQRDVFVQVDPPAGVQSEGNEEDG